MPYAIFEVTWTLGHLNSLASLLFVQQLSKVNNAGSLWGESSPDVPWWRHQIGTFSALLALCAGNSPVSGEVPIQRPVARSFDVFFDLRLNKCLSKHSRRRWFETPSCSLSRHCNAESIRKGPVMWRAFPCQGYASMASINTIASSQGMNVFCQRTLHTWTLL